MGFNVLLDPWVPLEHDGHVELASYRDVMIGVRDASDLRHTRPDFRFFARTLLSALTQALFAPRNWEELTERLRTPLTPAEFDAATADVLGDFKLLGGNAFLQDDRAFKNDVIQTDRLLLDVIGTSPLFRRPESEFAALCAPCGVLAVYGIQAFAAAGGAGLKAGVRGTPPISTLLKAPEALPHSVRASIWANVLSEDFARNEVTYAKDSRRPWNQDARQKSRASIGLVEGLFWQPRALRLIEAENGSCSTCGVQGPRVAVNGFEKKSGADKDGWYAHPYSPSRIKKGKQWFQVISADRPAWTGIADMTSTTVPDLTKGEGPQAAPVVRQWLGHKRNAVAVLDVFQLSFNKASILVLIDESYSLKLQIGDRDTRDYIRGFVRYAERCLEALTKALLSAHRSHKKDKGGFWIPDAKAAFWQSTGDAFWNAVAAIQTDDALDSAVANYSEAVRRVTIDLFAEHTRASALDPRKQQQVARANAFLSTALKKAMREFGEPSGKAE